MKRIAIYLRVSSDEQDVESQRAGVYALAAEKLPGVETVEYVDQGVSAFKNPLPSRPGSGAMLDDIEAGKVAAVVADSQDRLSRGAGLEIQLFLDACKRNDTRVLTVTGGELSLDGDDATFASSLISLAASYTARRESREKSHRSKRGRLALAEQGKHPGGVPAPGYKRGADGVLVADEPLAGMVAELFDLYLTGIGPDELGRRMAGLTGDQRWHRHRVGDVLDSPVYVGKIVNDGIEYQGLHEPLVDAETWSRVRELRAEAKATKRRQTRVQPYPSSILQCGDCGGRLTSHPDKRGNGWLDRRCATCRTSYLAEFIDLTFCTALGLTHALLADKLLDPSVGEEADQGVEQASNELTELRRRMLNLLPLVEDGDDEAVARHRELHAQASAADKRLERLRADSGERRSELERLLSTLDAFVGDGRPAAVKDGIANAWPTASIEQRIALIVSVAEQVEVKPDGRMRVKLRDLAQPFELRIRPLRRYTRESKSLRAVGFGAGAPS